MKKSTPKTYHCFFPECEYSTSHRSKIDFHHIVPKEIDPSTRNKSTICLCKNHHALIWHPQAKKGQHSIKTDESLIILGMFDSTLGKTVNYERTDGSQFFYTPIAKKYWD